ATPPDGTYELCGPMILGNPEKFTSLVLVPHGKEILADCPRDFRGLMNYLRGRDIEGVVWHRPDGRMPKPKGTDFGRGNGRPDKLAYLAGGLLSLGGFLPSASPRGRRWLGRILAAGLLAYVVLVGVLEPLEFIEDEATVLVAVAWLFPIILGGVLLPRRGFWV